MAQSTPYARGNGDGIGASFHAGLNAEYGSSAHANGNTETRGTGSSPLQAFGRHLTELSHETMTLMRQELELAKAEMRDSAREVGAGVSELAVGGGVAMSGFLVLLGAAVAGLAEIWRVARGTRVGGIALAIGLMLASRARALLDRQDLRPDETLAAARDTRHRVKEGLS